MFTQQSENKNRTGCEVVELLIDRDKINEAKEQLGDNNALLMAEMLHLEDFDEHMLIRHLSGLNMNLELLY